MFKIKDLGPVYSQPAEGSQGDQSGQGGGNGQQLPSGVQPGSAAAQAIVAQQAQQQNAGNGQQQDNGTKPPGYVPVGELAQERQKRHELEQQVAQLKTGQDQLLNNLKSALGVGGETAKTPEQLQSALQSQLQQQAAASKSALTQLAVHQLAPTAGADPSALLDSNTFLTAIKDLEPTDHVGIAKAIKDAVDKNKSLKAVSAGAGAQDAGQGAGNGAQKPTMNQLIRAGSGFGG